MTGPDHYREAERLLQLAANTDSYSEAMVATRRADVHAALALAAVTAMQAAVDGSEPGMSVPEFSAWYKAAGVKPKGGADRG